MKTGIIFLAAILASSIIFYLIGFRSGYSAGQIQDPIPVNSMAVVGVRGVPAGVRYGTFITTVNTVSERQVRTFEIYTNTRFQIGNRLKIVNY